MRNGKTNKAAIHATSSDCSSARRKMTNKYAFNVAMTCEGCSGAVKRILAKLGDKVTNVEINLEKQLVEVETDLSQDEILTILKKTGKDVSVTNA